MLGWSQRPVVETGHIGKTDLRFRRSGCRLSLASSQALHSLLLKYTRQAQNKKISASIFHQKLG
jgi:NifU-like protein involved in Fe-S cluster formation